MSFIFMVVIDSRGIRACVGGWVCNESWRGSGSGFLFSVLELELSGSSSTGTAAIVCDILELFNPFVFTALLPPSSSSLSLSLSSSFSTLFSIILCAIWCATPSSCVFTSKLVPGFLSLILSTDKVEVEVDGKYDEEEDGSVGNSDNTKSFRVESPRSSGPDEVGIPAFLAALLILPL